MALLDDVLAWAARGFRVFPLAPGEKIPPKGLAWKSEATTDIGKITSWWSFEPNYNYAVACGDGLLVIDVDAGKNGYVSLLDMDLPDTLTVRTPGGGVHMYFSSPDVKNSVDTLASGIDVRSAGGYVVGPGSYFADNEGKKGYKGSYQVVNDTPMVNAPTAIILKCGSPPRKETGPAVSEDEPDDITFAIHYLLKDAPLAVESRGGNDTTYAVAARVIEIGVSPPLTADLMAEYWNERCAPPWSKAELIKIAENAGNYLQQRQGSGGITAAAFDWIEAKPVALAPEIPQAIGKFDKIFANRVLTPLSDIPARAWVAHRLLLRNEASVLAGPGGVGKSGFSLALAAHGAVGRSFAGFNISKPFKTIIYNLEDSRHEMESRLYAACAVYGFDPKEIESQVLLWPGRELRFRLVGKDHAFAMADIQELARLTRGEGFDAMVLDPLVSLHHEDENNNSAMGEVMDALNGLARMANVAVLALHHTPKAMRQAGSSDSVRGAGNIVNSVRIAGTIYAADESDAALYGFGEGYRARFIRIDDAKQNLSPLETKPLWLEKQGFPLPCGDTSYALRVVEHSATTGGESKLMAETLASYMESNAIMHLTTYDAAKALAAADMYFRDKVPVSGDLRQLKALIELRLHKAVQTDTGETVRVVVKTEPGSATSRTFVELG